ncbi:hypothetical protein HF1_07690 [Mycoplasma haemofelis str. Langford 1]|uniref:Uncharacterized protein n=1 Tax=Mycoplasma haemofelis (strain Langford 1) TaxID=941640 RepID=E8ZI06_MYCHL|nr:hypothetical protein [Mycoplasma haemofelis]CBY92777.1 hypothetical protein HF1_07690 [Mycoplasma haemofelis str. Langford 1]
MSVLAPLKLAGLACAGVGGTCGAVYVGSSFVADVSKEVGDDDSVIQTVADKFGTRLISKNKKNGIWKKRLQKLKNHGSGELDAGLKTIKENADQPKAEQDLEAWCEESKIKPHGGQEHSLMVKGVESYCTYIIEEQVNGVVPKSKDAIGDWKLVNEAFVKAQKVSLSQDLQKVYDEVKGNETTSLKLKEWCFGKYEEPFKGKDDALYKEVSKVCKSVKTPKPASPKPAASAPSKQTPTSPDSKSKADSVAQPSQTI